MVNVYFLKKINFKPLSLIWLLFFILGFSHDTLAVDHKSEIFFNKIVQDKTINGIVIDTSGEALPGVNVYVKGRTSVGTVTDENGRFILDVPDENSVLVFSMVGYKTQEIAVGDRGRLNVILSSELVLDEAVVVAFGKQKRKDLVGSITSVNVEDLKVPSSNLTTALAGRVAGMIAFQRSGEPGKDNADFFIRGVSSFGIGKVDPLMLIDGVESSVTELARLQPDDIASFTVLKDATATALYGSRAANGVILIETKQGKQGKASVSFRVEQSWSSPSEKIKLADPITFMEGYNEAVVARDPFARLKYSAEKIDGTQRGLDPILYPANDWMKAVLKNYAHNQRYNLNVSGGGNVARYYAAGSFSRDNGLLRVDKMNNFNSNIDLKSYTLRANVDVNVTRTTQLIVRLSGIFDDYLGPLIDGGAMYNLIMQANPVDFPFVYPKDSAHQYVKHIMFGGLKGSFINPYATLMSGYRNYSNSILNAQFEVNQDFSFFTEGLSFRAMLNTNRTSYFEITRDYIPFYYEVQNYNRDTKEYKLVNINEGQGTEFLSFNVPARSQTNGFYLQSSLDYDRIFDEKHHVNQMLVYYMQSSINAQPGSLQLSLPSRNLGLSGRTSYSYDDKYYAEFNFGYNGSERFFKKHRYGFFPSYGIAWSVSNEKFWSSLKDKITNLRLRATYGVVGNDQIGDASDRFLYLSEVNMSDGSRGARFGRDYGYSAAGITIGRYSNTRITWEKDEQLNLGLELGLFNDLEIKADYFRSTRKNILMTRSTIPASMGLFAPVRANIGVTESQGLEVSLDYQKFFTNSWWMKLLGNFTYATNKYKVFEEPVYKNEPWWSFVGKAIHQQYGYIAERLFVDSIEIANSPAQIFGSKVIEGDIKYMDVNGDGIITDLDKVPIGHPVVPEIVYGFGFSFGYKGIDFSAFFQGLTRESFWISPADITPYVDERRLLMDIIAKDHYSADNRDLYAFWPRFDVGVNANNIQHSTWWLRNGSFLRLKQLEIGWTIPPKFSKKLYSKNTRIYVNGSNLFKISAFKLWDVEMGGNGLGYPIQRVLNVGINVNF